MSKIIRQAKADKKTDIPPKTDNMSAKRHLAQVLLSNVEVQLELAIKLFNRQYVSKK